MGRQTKAQQARKKAKTVKIDEGTSVEVPQSDSGPKQHKVHPGTAEQARIAQAATAFAEQLRLAQQKAQQRAKQTAAGNAPPATDQQVQAMHKLKALADLVQARPRPILEQLSNVGINWVRVRNVISDPTYDTIVMKVADIEEADSKLLQQGSIHDQLYGPNAGEN